MAEHIFEKDNEIGKRGESIFTKYLESRGVQYKDVSELPEYREIDVDFVVNGKRGDVLVEVKNDTKISYTGNIFYESISNVDYGTIGCFAKTEADWIAICSEPDRKIYMVKPSFLREYVDKNKNGLRYISRVEGSNSAGYLIPISKLKGELKVLSMP